MEKLPLSVTIQAHKTRFFFQVKTSKKAHQSQLLPLSFGKQFFTTENLRRKVISLLQNFPISSASLISILQSKGPPMLTKRIGLKIEVGFLIYKTQEKVR